MEGVELVVVRAVSGAIGAGWRRSGGAERAASGCERISGTSWAGGDTDDVTGTCARWPVAAV